MRIHPRSYLLPVLALSGFAACKSSGDAAGSPEAARRLAPSPSQRPTTGEPHQPPAGASGSSKTTAESDAPEAAVRTLLAAWLAAQNTGDFAAYERLYAERFTGIKRVGAHTARFDRKAWMKDRTRMLRPGVRVEAADPVIHAAGGFARVRFRQTFSAGTFRDVGMKELLVVREGDGLRIAREEMLDSMVQAAAAPSAEPLWFVHQGDVYLTQGVPERALGGPARLLPSSFPGTYAAERPLDAARLPSALRTYEGRNITVYREDGSTCRSQITQLRARAAGTPHFGVVSEWNGRSGSVATPDQRAAELWETTGSSDAYVVGRLSAECADGLYARPLEAESGGQAAVPAEGATKTAALAFFAKLPEYQAVQRRFVESGGEPQTPWESVHGTVTVTGVAGSKPRLVVVSAAAGRGCAEFGGALNVALLLDTEAAPPKLLRHHVLEAAQEALTLRRAVDLDGDGALELLTGPSGSRFEVSIFDLEGTKVSPRTVFQVPYWDCPC